MKQEFMMTEENYEEILQINKEGASPVMLIGGVDTGRSLQSFINAFWDKLGKEMRFDTETVEGSSKGKLYFLATPLPPEKSSSEKSIDSYDTLKKIVKQLEFCEYTSPVGAGIEMNAAFIALKRMAK